MKSLIKAVDSHRRGVVRAELTFKYCLESFNDLNNEIQKGRVPTWSSCHGDLIVAKERLDRAREMLQTLEEILYQETHGSEDE
jgi:hypothetical protein